MSDTSNDQTPQARWTQLLGQLDPSSLMWPGVENVPAVLFSTPNAVPNPARAPRSAYVWQRHDHPSAELCGQQIQADLHAGVHGVWIEAGLDRGMRTLSAGDLETALAQVDLTTTPIQLEGDNTLALAASLIAIAESRDLDVGTLEGGLGADPMASLTRTGALQGGLTGGFHELRATVALAEKSPALRPVLVSTRAYQEAGANPVDEICWAVATAIAYIQELLDDGYSVCRAARRIRFACAVGPRVFDEIAKLRALRLVWQKVLAASQVWPAMTLHAESSRRSRSIIDPHTNIMRGVAEMFAATIGGADTVSCAPYDSAMDTSDAAARRIARNTPLILGQESHIGFVSDPAGGSYLIEALTDRFAREGWTRFQQLMSQGGMRRAVEQGRITRVLDARREVAEQRVCGRDEVMVGVNRYPRVHETPLERPEINWRSIEGELGEDFGDGDHLACTTALRTLETLATHPPAAHHTEALASNTLKAIQHGVDFITLHASMHSHRPGLYSPPASMVMRGSCWEDLRQINRRALKKEHGGLVSFLANLGPLSKHRMQTQYATELMGCAGIPVRACDGFSNAQHVAAAFHAFGHDDARDRRCLVVLAGSEAQESDLLELIPKLRREGAQYFALIGPKTDAASAAGVEYFFADGPGLLRELKRLLLHTGVLKVSR